MEKPNRLAGLRDRPKLWSARPEQILPPLRGLDVRTKILTTSSRRRSFSLDIPIYRTSRDLTTLSGQVDRVREELTLGNDTEPIYGWFPFTQLFRTTPQRL